MIKTGLMRNRITIQHLDVVPNDIGQQIEQWSDYASVYAYASGYSGTEKYMGKRDIESADITFTVRFSERLANINTADYRVVFNKDIYNILFVDNYQFKNETLKILATTNGDKANE